MDITGGELPVSQSLLRTTEPFDPLHGSFVQNRPTWQKDEDVIKCPKCFKKFWGRERKHHCRVCGKIYCATCSDYWRAIDMTSVAIADRPDPVGIFEKITNTVASYTAQSEREKVRHCYFCYYQQGAKAIVDILFQLVPCIRLLKAMMRLSKEFKEAASIRFDDFRNIQYYLPNTEFKDDQKSLIKKVLIYNREHFAGHSRLLLHLLKNLDWNNPILVDQALLLMKKDVKRHHMPLVAGRPSSCFNLKCTKSCHASLQDAEALELLGLEGLHVEVYKYCVEILRKVKPVTMKCYLPTLVRYLNFEIPRYFVFELLVFFSLEDRKICTEVFYLLVVSEESTKHGTNWRQFKEDFVSRLAESGPEGKQLLDSLRQSQKLDRVLNTVTTLEQLNPNHAKCVWRDPRDLFPSILPCNPELTACGYNYGGCRVMKSATAPLLIPFWTDSEKTKSKTIIYKREDLRNDQIILNIIELMDQILRHEMRDDLKEETGDLDIVRFNVVPTSTSGGFIEVVMDALTLAKIKEQGQTPTSYLIHHKGFPTRTIPELVVPFQRSFTALCLINYLLGLGDRHLDNIMLKGDCRIFHIDFGYILGKDPRPLPVEMRITDQMLDVLGGVNADAFLKFKQLMETAYHILRRHGNLFAVLLSNLYEADPPIEKGKFNFNKRTFHDHMVTHYQPGVPDDRASETLHKGFEDSRNARVPSVVDWLRHNRELPEHTLSSVVDYGKEALNWSLSVSVAVANGVYGYWRGNPEEPEPTTPQGVSPKF